MCEIGKFVRTVMVEPLELPCEAEVVEQEEEQPVVEVPEHVYVEK